MSLHYKGLNLKSNNEILFVFHTSPLDLTYLYNSYPQDLTSVGLVFVDMPGHGESELRSNDDLLWPQIANSIDELRKELSLSNIHLLGHGIGGFIAQQYALSFPNHTSSVTLVNTSPNGKYRETMAWNIREKFSKVTIQALERYRGEITDKSLRVRFTQSLATYFEPVNHEHAKILMDTAVLIGTEAYVELSNTVIPNTDFRGQLRTLSIPVLIISSTKDVWPPNSSQLLRNDIITAEYLEFATGHFPMVEEPRNFWSSIIDFLSK